MDVHQHSEPCHRCHATLWEPIGDFVPRNGPAEDVIACAFCGLRVRVPAADDAAEFRFRFGRFKGMTLAEADAEPNGRRYLEILRDKNDKLRDRIVEYLSHAKLPQ